MLELKNWCQKMKNKKAVTSEVFVIVLLVCVLAAIVVIWLMWSRRGRELLEMLSAMFLL